MNRTFLYSLLALVSLATSANAGTLTVINHWSSAQDSNAPNMFLYMDYKTVKGLTIDTGSGPKAMANKKYYDITGHATVKLAWTTINSGNLSYCTFASGTAPATKWSMNSADNLSGFVEFSQLAASNPITCDLSNVDGIGLLCGLAKLPPSETDGGKAGYKSPQTEFVTNIQKITSGGAQFPSGALIPVKIKGKTYEKVVAPGKSAGTDPWTAFLQAYYGGIQKKDYTLSLKVADNGGVQWNGSQSAAGTTVTGIPEPIAVKLKSTYMIGATSYDWDVYVAKSVWTPETISRADSGGGLYVRTTYPLPATAPGYEKTGKIYGVNNQHLNWQVDPDTSTQPRYCQNVAALFRDLMVGFQLGMINPASSTYTSPNQVAPYTYGGNMYNKFIMDNSNSYGNPYSDNSAAGGKVLYSPPTAFEVHILSPSDATTGSYYSKTKPHPAGTGNLLLGAPSTLLPVFVNGTKIDATKPFSSNRQPVLLSFGTDDPTKVLKANFTTREIVNAADWNFASGCQFSTVVGKTHLALPANLSWKGN